MFRNGGNKKGRRKMNANELADELTKMFRDEEYDRLVHEIPDMLRQQQAEYYSLLVNHDLLYAKVVEQQAEIKALKAKTLTDEEIKTLWKPLPDTKTYDSDILKFSRAILRKAQEK